MKPKRPTALLIPSPWDGDENSINGSHRLYHAWHWLYKNTRKLRHLFGLHDWESWTFFDRVRPRCSWCGRVKR